VQVACPHCGAPETALTESRFYRCGYCGSSYVVQGEQGIRQYCCSHRRDDRLAWSALAEELERKSLESSLEKGSVDFLLIPFWCFTRESGTTRMIPAVAPPVPEVTEVTLPGVDLQYPQPGEELTPPEISLTDAEQGLTGGAITTRFLVYLPIYLLSYTSNSFPFQAVVSGADRKVYAGILPSRAGIVIPRRHLLMVGFYALLLILEGVAIRRPEWRAAAYLFTGLTAWSLCYALLRRES
jgi:hypothetical protein